MEAREAAVGEGAPLAEARRAAGRSAFRVEGRIRSFSPGYFRFELY
jgi:hypothetical protein